MAYNPTPRVYDKDYGAPVPNVRFCPTERPRIQTWPAPYLPLQLRNKRHEWNFVVLTGKVVALDDMGFLVPAGLALQLDTLEAELKAVAAAGGAVTVDVSPANANLATLTRYSAVDVEEGVKNIRGQTVKEGEPVVLSFFTDDGVAFPQYNSAAAGTSTAMPLADGSVIAREWSVGPHIGFAPYSYVRTSSSVTSRSASDMQPAATGKEARVPYDPTQLDKLAFEPQAHVAVLVADECLLYPVVANRDDVLIKGQAVAIGAMADFKLGEYVTFNADSDIVPHDVVLTGLDYSDDDDADISAAIASSLKKYHNRCIGQVVRKNTRFPSSYLDKVKTQWDASIPGFSKLHRMAGSATEGYPWHMHTAGSTLGEVQISPLMR